MTVRVAMALLANAIPLAGCGEAVPHAEPPDATAMDELAITTAKGTGTVTALDVGAGTVTMDHAPIPEIGWPSMTMTFRADPGLLAGVKQGEKVAFDLAVKDNVGTVTALKGE